MSKTKEVDDKRKRRERISLGLFFILFGIALLVAINDMLGLGSVSAYFTWDSILMFIGLIMFINQSYLAGFVCVAGSGWFLLDNIFFIVPPILKTVYWPAVLVLLGIGFIIGSFIKKR